MTVHRQPGGGEASRVSLLRRRDGRWRVRWREQGRDVERTFAADAHADAQQLVAELEGRLPASRAPQDGPVTWGELRRRWMSAKRTSWDPSIAEQNSQILSKWAAPWLEDVAITEVTGELYQQVFANMDEHGRQGSLPRVRSLLSQLEAWAADNDYRPPRRFPVRLSRTRGSRPKVHGAKPEFVSPRLRPDTARIEVVRDAMVHADPNGAWWRSLHTDVAAFSGLRLGETFALRSCHVDVTSRRVQVLNQYVSQPGVQAQLRPPKFNKVRTAILLPHMVDDMQRRLIEVRNEGVSPVCEDCADPACGLLFPAPFGGPHNRSHFGAMARDAFELTWGHENPSLRWPRTADGGWLWKWRDLRHHAAVLFLDRFDLPAAEAALLLGHTEQVLLARYYGPMDDAIDRALKATA